MKGFEMTEKLTEGVLFKCINQRVFVATRNLERAAPIMDAVDGFHFLDAKRRLLAISVSDRNIEALDLHVVREALLEKCDCLQRQVDDTIKQIGRTQAVNNTRGWK